MSRIKSVAYEPPRPDCAFCGRGMFLGNGQACYVCMCEAGREKLGVYRMGEEGLDPQKDLAALVEGLHERHTEARALLMTAYNNLRALAKGQLGSVPETTTAVLRRMALALGMPYVDPQAEQPLVPVPVPGYSTPVVHPDDRHAPAEVRRASGEEVCDVCGFQFRQHQLHQFGTGLNPLLVVKLCVGRRTGPATTYAKL